MKKEVFLIITLFLAFNLNLISENRDSLNDQIETTIQNYIDSLLIPGISAAVILNGEIQYKHSFGFSNLEYDIPMTDSSVFRVWSISKQICAVAILKLYEEGKLKLNDKINIYLDSIPKTWGNITITQLLNHTAGIKDYLNNYPEGKKLNGRSFEEVKDSTALLLFETGKGWSYTNTGYWVLTKIIEKITETNYQEYIKNVFFDPFGMKDTRKMDFRGIIKNRVSGYRQVDGKQQNSTRYLDENHVADGDGELISTLNDLTIWSKRLFTGQIISLESLELAWDEAMMDNGEIVDGKGIIFYDTTSSYGMGWFISKLNNYKTVWTPGAGRGFSTTIFSVPEKEIHIIVLSNTRRFLIADRIAKKIAGLIIQDDPTMK
jgi:CubicO group peptidase (beta-lactamase class C family)